MVVFDGEAEVEAGAVRKDVDLDLGIEESVELIPLDLGVVSQVVEVKFIVINILIAQRRCKTEVFPTNILKSDAIGF